VRFQNQGEALAEVSFPLNVEKRAGTSGPGSFIWLAAGLLTGVLAGFFAGVARRRKE